MKKLGLMLSIIALSACLVACGEKNDTTVSDTTTTSTTSATVSEQASDDVLSDELLEDDPEARMEEMEKERIREFFKENNVDPDYAMSTHYAYAKSIDELKQIKLQIFEYEEKNDLSEVTAADVVAKYFNNDTTGANYSQDGMNANISCYLFTVEGHDDPEKDDYVCLTVLATDEGIYAGISVTDTLK